ncbi:MAG: DEAD/DEAH box helicase [Chitinophagales bacterium]|nr:DEAD/DEAH box helicase [Chitinophagales bacterium]
MSDITYSIDNILANLNIEALNEMQLASVAGNKEHDNVLLLSATGSGKTLAFLLPVLDRLDPGVKTTQALIVVPSRELALQIESVFRQMGTGKKITCCYGGHLRETEENNLIEPPALIVGTPGRLCDHIRRGSITVNSIETLVMDEFDKSLELGFQEEVAFIIESCPNIKKRILTSATEAVEIPEFVGFEPHEQLNFLTRADDDDKLLDVKVVHSPDKNKADTLFRLICHLGNRSTIIFCNHRDFVDETSKMLRDKGINSVFYHGGMEQRERDSALCKFRNGSSNVLVTTDLAARGLDIPNIRYIIHYQLPQSEDIYTHRNGRTARMDASGTVILVLHPEEYLPPYINKDVEQIELPEEAVLPEKPKWTTLFISAGKKDKVNKVDIVGFLAKKGELKKEDIGLIEVKDFFSFVAVRRSKAGHTLHMVKDERLKNKKLKIHVAK